MRVNVKSVFLGCKYALAQMLAQEPHTSGDRGWIINISSIMGMIAGPENRKTLVYANLQTDLTSSLHSILLCI
jgi:NAD(P)-dependent dehydrogenase (short-subunit alcohol dehydrogenase family)